MNKPLTWYKLSTLENGEDVVFTENTQCRLLPSTEPRDIRDSVACVVSKGTEAKVLENGLNELWCCLVLRIAGKPVMDVVIGQHLDPSADTHVPVAERDEAAKAWFAPSPVARS